MRRIVSAAERAVWHGPAYAANGLRQTLPAAIETPFGDDCVEPKIPLFQRQLVDALCFEGDANQCRPPAPMPAKREIAIVVAAAGAEPVALHIEADHGQDDPIELAWCALPAPGSGMPESECVATVTLAWIQGQETHDAAVVDGRCIQAAAAQLQCGNQGFRRKLGGYGEIDRYVPRPAQGRQRQQAPCHTLFGEAPLSGGLLTSPKTQTAAQILFLRRRRGSRGVSRLCRHPSSTLRRRLKWVPIRVFGLSAEMRTCAPYAGRAPWVCN